MTDHFFVVRSTPSGTVGGLLQLNDPFSLLTIAHLPIRRSRRLNVVLAAKQKYPRS